MNLQEVENAIIAMNQAAFQELGDLFLISKDSDYKLLYVQEANMASKKLQREPQTPLFLRMMANI